MPPPLPTISIVVPNYNGAATLAATLESLVGQGYPSLEVIVVDGGSTDASVEIIRRFESRLAWWVSEPDAGQSAALNKGFARATGEVVNWLCSDDRLLQGCLEVVGRYFAEHPEVDVVSGRGRWVYNDGKPPNVDHPTAKNLDLIPACCPAAQPSTFYRRRLLDRDAPIDTSYHYLMDLELWAYFRRKRAEWRMIDDVLSETFISGMNKTNTGGRKIIAEAERLWQAYQPQWIPMTFWHKLLLPLDRWRRLKPTRPRHFAVRAVKAMLFTVLAPFYGMRRLRAMNWSSHA
jgi:glycosyltransferase involved in cell wall biosynthesis